ncbi:hypothetical protein RhiJN_22398 [Ceratobasidium sp. AG-Ba]|nr:hypothetical protein RhiJN_22398 [Ceratobasidium sp. AG-Ba]
MLADHSKYVGDSSANARTNRATRTANNNRATSSRASTTNTCHTNRPCDHAIDHPRPQDADPPRGRSDLPLVVSHAPVTLKKTTTRLDPALNPTSASTTIRLPRPRVKSEKQITKALSGTKGKQRTEPPHEITPPIETYEESEEEEENIRMFTKKVKAGPRQHTWVISPGPKAQTSKSVTKSQPKSNKSTAKNLPPKKRKSAQESNSEEEKRRKNDTATGSKCKVEKAEDEGQQTKQPTQKRARPTPKW